MRKKQDGGRRRRETNEEAGRRRRKKPEEGLGRGRRGENAGRRWKKDWETNEEDGRRMRKKPEEGGRIWKKGDEGGMFSESIEIRRNLTSCYGWLTQPATQNTNTWLCQPVAHKREIKSMGWIDGRLGGYAGGSMEMDRWIYGRMDGKQCLCLISSFPNMVDRRCPRSPGLINGCPGLT